MALTPDEISERIANITQKRASDSYRRLQGENDRMEYFLRRIGEKPPEETKGFLSTALDILDTGGQFVRGGIASALGVEGYEKDNVLEGAIRGTQNDLTVGEILRKKGILKDHSFLRAAAGFVGDVVTDPLTFLTFGGGLGAKIGGKTVSRKGIKVAGKKIAGEAVTPVSLHRQLADDILKKGRVDIENAVKLGRKTESEGKIALDILEASADADAAEGFKLAKSLLAQKKKFGRIAPEQITPELKKSFAAREKVIRDMLDLAADQPIEDLFATPAIRFSNPFAGAIPFGPGGKRIGILSRNADIPGITPGSEKVLELLGGKLYNARAVVAKGGSKALKQLRKTGGPGEFLAGIIEGAGQVPSLFSKNIQAGGKAVAETIDEHQVAKAFMRKDVELELGARFAKFRELAGDQADPLLERMTQMMQGALRPRKSALDAVRRGEKAALQAADYFEDPKLLDKVRGILKAELDSTVPGLGDEALKLVDMARADFDEFAKIEEGYGLLSNTIEGYIQNAYETPVGAKIADAAKKAGESLMANGRPRFTLERTFAKMDDAFVERGLIPKYNFQERLAARTIAHRSALAERDFFERLGFEFGLDRQTYKTIDALVRSKNERVADAALEFLDRAGFDSENIRTGLVDGKDALGSTTAGVKQLAKRGGLEESAIPAGLKLRDSKGNFATPEVIANYRRVAFDQSIQVDAAARAAAKHELTRMGLAEGHDDLIESMGAFYNEYQKGLLGRAGETLETRAGAELVNENFRKFIAKNADEESARFFRGILPKSLVSVINDSFEQKTILKQMTQNMRGKGHARVADALDKFTDGYIGWVNNLKFGATQVWPSFHLRNLGSAQFLGTQEASILGEQLNPLKFLETYALRNMKGQMIQEGTGAVLDAKKLINEARRFGFLNENPMHIADIIEDHATILSKLGNKLPGKKLLGKMSNHIENIGREHLYFQLRKAGYDPKSAANRVGDLMVNYARGKTRFERDIVNNMIFFYSFARATTVNQLNALITRPGALTAQLHAIDGVKEFLLDPNAVPLPRDEEQEITTLRGSETIPRFIGRGESGNPIFLQNVGMPIEEVSRFVNLKVPGELSAGAIVDAGVESAQRTANTIVASASPPLKVIMENIIAKKNFYFDRPIDDRTLRKFPMWGEDVPKLLPYDFKLIPKPVWDSLNKATKEVLNGRSNGDGTMTVDPHRLALLGVLVPGADRFRSQYGALSKKGVSDKAKILRLFSGVKAVEVEPEKSRVYDKNRRLKKYIDRIGGPRTLTELQIDLLANPQDDEE